MIVLCDVAGVMVDFDDEISFRILQEAGVHRAGAMQMYKQEFEDFSRGRLSDNEYVRLLNDRHFNKVVDIATIQRAHDEHFTRRNDNVVGIIQSIPRERVAIITDTNAWQHRRIAGFIDLVALSNNVFESHEMGMIKTDPGSFPHVIRSLGVPAADIVLIDDLRKNVDRARGFGMKAVLYQSTEQLRGELARIGMSLP
ncbi:HAD-IA family hydrolase [Candidatus Uhrbacteria bacterium]|nr:HAD-IA family hydrolase [Candidatus Uhrbacteria bacterium]